MSDPGGGGPEDPDVPHWSSARAQAWLQALGRDLDGAEAEAARGLDPHGRALEMRRWLQAGAGGPVAPEALLRLRREVEGARLHAAGLLRVATCGGGARVGELARARFGAAPRLVSVGRPEQALAAAASPGVVAVIAMEGAWWGRLLAQPQLQVFARLPDAGPLAALAVAQVETAPTGADETWWVTDASGPASRIEARLGEAGFAADLQAEAGGLKLFALAGYVQGRDARLAGAPGRLSGVVGASPVGV